MNDLLTGGNKTIACQNPPGAHWVWFFGINAKLANRVINTLRRMPSFLFQCVKGGQGDVSRIDFKKHPKLFTPIAAPESISSKRNQLPQKTAPSRKPCDGAFYKTFSLPKAVSRLLIRLQTLVFDKLPPVHPIQSFY